MRLLTILLLCLLATAAVAISSSKPSFSSLVGNNMKAFHSFMADKETNVSWSYGENTFSVQRPEGMRSFITYVPQSYNGNSAVPLVFAFHGLGDSCQNFIQGIEMEQQADKYGFILVAPCGYTGILGNAWNAGTCCLRWSNIDDVAFTRTMVSFLSDTFTIDKSKIFTSGFSNGAMFSERLACEASDLFQAAASVSGCVELEPGNAQGLAACDKAYANGARNVSVLMVHGDFDFVVPWTGDAILGFPDIPTNFAAWSNRTGCFGNPVQTLNETSYTNQVYQHCNGVENLNVEVVRHHGGGHEWPIESQFDTTTYIINFFAKFF